MTRALVVLAVLAARQEARFAAYDVVVDAGEKPLAAYQLEIRGGGQVVGVEGGEPRPYASAPYYDPAALQGGRIVLAAFTPDDGAPTGKVRVARLHVREAGPADYAAKLIVAAAPGGDRIPARLELVRLGGKK